MGSATATPSFSNRLMHSSMVHEKAVQFVFLHIEQFRFEQEFPGVQCKDRECFLAVRECGLVINLDCRQEGGFGVLEQATGAADGHDLPSMQPEELWILLTDLEVLWRVPL